MPTTRPLAALAVAMTGLAAVTPARAQAPAVQGPYVSLGVGLNLMTDENISSTNRFGGFTTNFFGTPFTVPATTGGVRSRNGFDPGFVGLIAAGYGLGNGLRLEVEGNYRRNDGTNPRYVEQKYGGMFNVLYDLPLGFGTVQPYAGLGAGYIWADRETHVGRTSSFAYQAILGASMPLTFVPGLAATFEYRFMGLAGAAERDTYPATAFTGTLNTTTKYNDDFNHSLLFGLRYAFNAAPPPLVMASPAPAPAPAAARTYLVFFDWDRADLTDRARQIIAEAAAASTRVAVTRIEVDGYTDRSGTPRYNQGLSLRRADAVAAELVRNGVPAGAITKQGFGETRPLVPTAAGVREAQNRRVEIILK